MIYAETGKIKSQSTCFTGNFMLTSHLKAADGSRAGVLSTLSRSGIVLSATEISKYPENLTIWYVFCTPDRGPGADETLP